MNVTLRQLRVFQAVADSRNFSRAGDRIGLTQPAVSRCIHELEGQLGLKLVNRTTREVELTEAGRSLAGRLDRLLDELEIALSDVQGMATQRRGKVRVASSPTLSANLMPACIAECQRSHPGIQLVLLDRIQQDVLGSVRAGEVDFGLVIDPGSPEDLHGEVILSEPFCLVCPPGHRFARRRSVPWRELTGERLVLLDHASGSRRLIDLALANHQVRCEVVQELGHPTTAFRMVEAGLGITVLPALALHAAELSALCVRPLTPRVDRDVMLVHRRNRALAPVVQTVWNLIRDVVATVPVDLPAMRAPGSARHAG
ncbi:LysR family transcriptional regulator [Variovorax terrae]|uniref:LysR family transcriptional regulator n=1 Tax=Variovorax terrae TaxID=2923278 RepID=A0A9X2APT9_9BURK|nr:LysR family transcriptional regulator [Variovorax terrae]MCJ0765245.1 LysR family transcriptional regulator [Variovorax terrae]